jgi:zinc transporter
MTDSAAESDALICAFRLEPFDTLGSDALAFEPSPNAPAWLHFNLLDNRARRHLEQRPALDAEGRETLLSAEPRVHVQYFSGGFAAILGDLHHDFHVDPEGFGLLGVYVDESVIITCRRHRVRSIDRLRQALQREPRSTTPLAVFTELLDRIVEGFVEVIASLAERVEQAEDRVLAGRAVDPASELGHVRRVLVRLRRHASANRGALHPLSQRIARACDDELRQRLSDVIARLDAAGQDMELVAERARLLQEELAGRLGEATNRNLYVLSVVTTALLPITLITGIFGMNVGGLPLRDSEHGFWWVMLGIGITVVTTLRLLRRPRLRQRP